MLFDAQIFQEFIDKNNGKPLEVEDSSNLDQCFDLVLGWLDVLQVPHDAIRHLNASQIYTNPTDETLKYFEVIPNTPFGIPHMGDIVVFSGKVGHTCVATGKGTNSSFESFDENWDTPHFHDAKGNPICRLVTHSYNQVLGWLRIREVYSDVLNPITDKTRWIFGKYGELELGTVLSMLQAKDQLIDEQVKKIGELSIITPQEPVIHEITKVVYQPETSRVPRFIRKWFGDSV